jgi:uncharacterized integral membrane protein
VVVLGLLLLILSGGLTAAVLLQNTGSTSVDFLGLTFSGLTLGGVFAAGVVTGAVALLGLALMLGGARRRRARRLARRQEVREVRDERETLAEENARLQRELAERTNDATVYPTDTTSGRHGVVTKD